MIQTSWGEFGWAQCAVVVHSTASLLGGCEQTDWLTHDWLFISPLQQQKAWKDRLCSAAPQYSSLWYLWHTLSFTHPFPLYSLFSTQTSSCLILHVKYLTRSDIFFNNLTSSCFNLLFFFAFHISILFIYLSIHSSFFHFFFSAFFTSLFICSVPFYPCESFFLSPFSHPCYAPLLLWFGHNTSFCCIFYYAAALPRWIPSNWGG